MDGSASTPGAGEAQVSAPQTIIAATASAGGPSKAGPEATSVPIRGSGPDDGRREAGLASGAHLKTGDVPPGSFTAVIILLAPR